MDPHSEEWHRNREATVVSRADSNCAFLTAMSNQYFGITTVRLKQSVPTVSDGPVMS